MSSLTSDSTLHLEPLPGSALPSATSRAAPRKGRAGRERRAWLLVALGLAACELNPVPEEPFLEDGTGGAATDMSGGTGGEVIPVTSTGGTSTGGTSSGDTGGASTITGGSATTGTGGTGNCGTCGSGGSAMGVGGSSVGGAGETWAGGTSAAGGTGPSDGCVGSADSAFIDDAADCDTEVELSNGILGTWFGYDSSPDVTGSFNQIAHGEFQMTPTSGSDCAAQVSGGGYGEGGFVGVGVSLQTLEGERCAEGYDATAYSGLSFAARGFGELQVLVETTGSSSSSGPPGGHATSLPLQSTWSTYTVPWELLRPVSSAGGAPEAVDTALIRTIRFQTGNPSGFDFWVDDLTFTVAPTGGAGGAGGALTGGEGGACAGHGGATGG